jgi:hypothetical protein
MSPSWPLATELATDGDPPARAGKPCSGAGATNCGEMPRTTVSAVDLDHTVPLTLPWDETFDIGSDTATPVDDQDYGVPFAFHGKTDKLTFAIEPPRLTPEDERKLQEAYRAAQDAN